MDRTPAAEASGRGRTSSTATGGGGGGVTGTGSRREKERTSSSSTVRSKVSAYQGNNPNEVCYSVCGTVFKVRLTPLSPLSDARFMPNVLCIDSRVILKTMKGTLSPVSNDRDGVHLMFAGFDPEGQACAEPSDIHARDTNVNPSFI